MSASSYIETKISAEKTRGMSLKKTATICLNSIRKAGLDAEPEESEHKWHADIINWSEDKAERKLQAIELAKCAKIET